MLESCENWHHRTGRKTLQEGARAKAKREAMGRGNRVYSLPERLGGRIPSGMSCGSGGVRRSMRIAIQLRGRGRLVGQEVESRNANRGAVAAEERKSTG